MKTIKLIGVLFIGAILTACGGESTTENEAVTIQEINPAEALEMTADATVQMIDVRGADEIAKQAYDVENIMTIPLDEIESRLNEIPKDKKIIVACRSGKRSMKAANILLENGYTSIYSVKGGILAWEEDGLGTVSTSSCCSDPTSEKCNPDGTCK